MRVRRVTLTSPQGLRTDDGLSGKRRRFGMLYNKRERLASENLESALAAYAFDITEDLPHDRAGAL